MAKSSSTTSSAERSQPSQTVATASLDPGAIRLIFWLDKCVECKMTTDGGCFWRFASGLTLTLSMPDESKLRFVPHWHIGEVQS